MAEKLPDDAIADRLNDVPEWDLDGKMITRRFRFSGFPQSMAFVNGVADIAEANNHHPFISIDFKVVTLRLTSWHAGGLTAADFAEAMAADALYAAMSAG